MTYDLQWEEAMAELSEQIHIEDHTLDIQEGNPVPQPVIKNTRTKSQL